MLPSDYAGEWWLIRTDLKDNLIKQTDPSTGELVKIFKQSIWTVVIARSLFNVTTFGDEMNQTKSAFSVRTGPATQISMGWTGKKFVCTGNPLVLKDAVTGQYEEEQTWVYYGVPEEIDPSRFTG